VVAERSDRWTPELRARARALPPSARVTYHELPNAGHWVHVDNPDGLLALLRQHLPS
jgi:pimeloyl-ACP methyl ester carboxylesterase